MLAVVDLNIGNIGSLMRALELTGSRATLTSDPFDVASASAIILPGVGAFGAAMQSLHDRKLVDPLRAAAAAGVPLLGICLGMQLLAGESEEYGRHEGLGLIPGRVRRLNPTRADLRVPNIGWVDVVPSRASILFGEGSGCFYHVHSYHVLPDDPSDITATIRYGDQAICVAVERRNIYGVQFHPEKSQDDGLALLGRFANHLKQMNNS
jgi:glutamine amidotransferase